MTLEGYRKRLILIWCVGFGIPFALLFVQFFGGKYGFEKGLEALGWLTSLTLSTILLMFGVMVSNPVAPEEPDDPRPDAELSDEEKKKRRDKAAKAAHEKSVFQLAAGVSIVYLLIINAVFFLEPLTSDRPQELMRYYKVFLAVCDSLLSLLLGYFFGKK
jgi:hypothetical protein